ncbi:ATP-binding cassette subfamily B protein [Kibdelosporangium banguiense]|uniref:ATP-binding cassette subfamily B protein n=1 Tax=Kibdelosporangium banguiense TaxID=1365924 RepID=A0ABS4TVJ1_9PSEU|nr:ABC transporter ATP-binding protein [Kibdelosporangium banguiense]MBP2328420.1 ATP-binding cassette subfamily B protein [Kibdelosporangium banguiense]
MSTIMRVPAVSVAKALATVVVAGSALVLPLLSARVVDVILDGGEPGAALLAFAAVLVLAMLAEMGGEVTGVLAETTVLSRLRHRLMGHVFRLGVPGSRQYPVGDLVARFTANAAFTAKAVPYRIEAAVGITAAVGGWLALSVIDWRAGAAFALGTVPLLVLIRRRLHTSTSRFAEYLEQLAAISARLTDALAGSRTIRASGTLDREVRRVLEPLPALAASGRATWDVRRAVSWQVGLAQHGLTVLVLVVVGLGVAAGRTSPGDFLAAALYLTVALGFVQQLDTLLFLADARAGARRVHDVLLERPRFQAGGDVVTDGPGALAFRGIRVCANGRTVLDGIDLDVPAGTVLGVVGRSGSGKSTLGLLAGRLIDPDEGEVLLDGVPLHTLAPEQVRAAVGYAFDKPVLLGGTIRDAISFGRSLPDRHAVERACRLAQAEDFVRRLPRGLDTPLAEAPLSGGELQRLGLARAMVEPGRVLVLDDATSSLDTATEARLAVAFTGALSGRTRLLIAHRAITAARTDAVAWLDHGRVRAVAPHSQLWETEPDYRAIFGAEKLS